MRNDLGKLQNHSWPRYILVSAMFAALLLFNKYKQMSQHYQIIFSGSYFSVQVSLFSSFLTVILQDTFFSVLEVKVPHS